MTTTIELIEQAEENVAQLQAVLERTQKALSVAEHVDVAARRTRPFLKWLLILSLIGVVVVVVRKVMASDDDRGYADSTDSSLGDYTADPS